MLLFENFKNSIGTTLVILPLTLALLSSARADRSVDGLYQNQFGYRIELDGERLFYTGQWQGKTVTKKQFPLIIDSKDSFSLGANNCNMKKEIINCIRPADGRIWDYVLIQPKPFNQSSNATKNSITSSSSNSLNTTSSTAEVNNKNALVANKQLINLAAQLSFLEQVLQEQLDQKINEKNENQSAIDFTITTVQAKVDDLKREYSERNKNYNQYISSIQPNDKNLYLTSRKASEIYPKIPYYIPGTSETGEFWIEPYVNDSGVMNFSFKFIDVDSPIDKIRSKIEMNLDEIQETQNSLIKLYHWSQIAHEKKIRKNYEKRIACFPVTNCPTDIERIEGKTSTEIRFNIYEDGSTAGRIQRNKGRFIEGYNLSIESAMLLQAYLNHVINEAKQEYQSGTQDKKALDKLFE